MFDIVSRTEIIVKFSATQMAIQEREWVMFNDDYFTIEASGFSLAEWQIRLSKTWGEPDGLPNS